MPAHTVTPTATTTIAKFKKSDIRSILGTDGSLLTIISMESPKQTGSNFKAFVVLVNDRVETDNVSLLYILLTGELHIHYLLLQYPKDPEQSENDYKKFITEKAKEMNEKWQRDNEATLQHLKCKVAIITWGQLRSDHENTFQVTRRVIQYLYNNEQEFQEIVDQHSKIWHGNKLYKKQQALHSPGAESESLLLACRNASVNYIVEEAAFVAAILSSMRYTGFCYPGQANKPIEWLQNHQEHLPATNRLPICVEYELTTKKLQSDQAVQNSKTVKDREKLQQSPNKKAIRNELRIIITETLHQHRQQRLAQLEFFFQMQPLLNPVCTPEVVLLSNKTVQALGKTTQELNKQMHIMLERQLAAVEKQGGTAALLLFRWQVLVTIYNFTASTTAFEKQNGTTVSSLFFRTFDTMETSFTTAKAEPKCRKFSC